jgi:hypothetical protein
MSDGVIPDVRMENDLTHFCIALEDEDVEALLEHALTIGHPPKAVLLALVHDSLDRIRQGKLRVALGRPKFPEVRH